MNHLEAVGRIAGEFAAEFGSGDWGRIAGLWHDIGKFQPEFQRRLQGEKIAVEHSGAGAALAWRNKIQAIAFLIAGHHAGLANPVESIPNGPKPLKERVQENLPVLEKLMGSVPDSILSQPTPSLPGMLIKTAASDSRSEAVTKRTAELWIRFLFSALTDADYLDTEAFLDPERSRDRVGFDTLGLLLQKLESEIASKTQSLTESLRNLPVNRARAAVADACRGAAASPAGIFSLTAPTGAGKTLSGMLFALKHAETQGQRRVVVVLPYTSIIEQNAEVYRRVFGVENVVEHHSTFDPAAFRQKTGQEYTSRQQLACENWDAPIIVTTTVQFFESLFSNRSSRCRKLHNVARSVVILDEVQSLPPGLLAPILDVLNELAAHYGCSVVLSTATPPALLERPNFPGLRNVREIMPDPSLLAKELKRVRYCWPAVESEPMSWEALADGICSHPRALAVVHRRDDARQLATLVKERRPEEVVFHLSALMCPTHRSVTLERVRAQLASGQPCRLISTQLIEAGVDIDFPVLYRALTGLDSIVQAAGRCNREGLADFGDVHVFLAPTPPPAGVPRRGLSVMAAMLRANGAGIDPSSPEVCGNYFRDFYFASALDDRGIQASRGERNFATVARDFKLIEDGCTATVIVPYGDAEERVNQVRKFANRESLRRLQTYSVRIYPHVFHNLQSVGALEEIYEDIYVLTVPFRHLYDEKFGLVLSSESNPDVSSLII